LDVDANQDKGGKLARVVERFALHYERLKKRSARFGKYSGIRAPTFVDKKADTTTLLLLRKIGAAVGTEK
jgi:hypothetical protein